MKQKMFHNSRETQKVTHTRYDDDTKEFYDDDH